MFRRLAATLFLIAATTLSLQAQESTELIVGSKIERTLASDGSHGYTIDLAEDMFVFGYADQLSVDVVVTIKNPAGEVVKSMDGPGVGPEFFQFESEASGTYSIEVTPFEEATGDYTILIEQIEPVAQSAEERVDQLFVQYDRDSFPGVVVAIVEGENITFEKAYGMANLTHGIPFTVETVTNIGSTSKQFTAMGISLLAQQGKLSLDDDVRTHIPELPDLGQVVTIRNLLTHTSGYREFLNFLAISGRRLFEGDHIDRAEIIEIVQRQPELQNEPGSEWNYNNTAFGLAAVVIERVSEESFPDWMEENVFKPAGMRHTRVRSNVGEVIPNSAQGYVPGEGGGFQEASDLSGAMGAGGIYTTVGDLARWMRNYHTAELGGASVIEAMTTPFVLSTGDTTSYGMGIFVDEVRGLRRYQHGGADTAHRSTFVYYPDLESGYIIQSNYSGFDGSVGTAIAEAFFEEQMTAKSEEVADAASSEFDPDEYDPEDFDVFVARYELDSAPGFILSLFREEDQLFTQATGQSRVEIFPTSDSTFALRVVDAQITFHRDSTEKVTSLTLHQNGNHLAQRLPDEEANAPSFNDYVGRYFSEELETYYDIVIEDSSLVIQHRRLDDVTIRHGSGDKFTGAFPLNNIEFVRSEEGDVTGFRVGNGRTRNVWVGKLDS